MVPTPEQEARQNVTAAIAFLDKHAPEGWRERVNVHEIQMVSWHKCILGQVYAGEDSDLGPYGWAQDHLTQLDRDGYRMVKIAFANYDAEWKRQLQEGT